MPYITPSARARIDAGGEPADVGELNYAITKMVLSFLGWPNVRLRYGKVNSVVGVLECAKLELYRKLAAPYENEKADENGDVYA